MFESGFFITLIRQLPLGWNYKEVRVTEEFGVESWDNRFFCRKCWMLEEVNTPK